MADDPMYSMEYRGLGSRFSPSTSRFAASLLGRQNYNNGTHAGGLASVAQNIIQAMLLKNDMDAEQKNITDTNLANNAMVQGMTAKPWVNPDTGQAQGTAGGYEGGMAALSNLDPSNAAGGRLAQALLMNKMKNDQEKELATFKSQLPGQGPSSVQEWQYYNSLSKPDQERYLTMKRANNWRDLGGSVVLPSQIDPAGAPLAAVPKTLPPEQTPETKGAQAAAVKSVDQAFDKKAAFPKAEAALKEFERSSGIVLENVNKALEAAKKGGATGWNYRMFSGYPNTEAGALKSYLDPIRANIGFDKLSQMRAASPTGGALGAVSELENKLLQATQGSLDPEQEASFIQTLQMFSDMYPQLLNERRAAFAKDYADMIGQQPSPASDPNDPLGLRRR